MSLSFVDDLIITGNDLLLVEQIKAALCQQFEMTDLGTLHFFLGLEIQQSRHLLVVCSSPSSGM